MTDFRCLSQNVDQRCLGLHVGVGEGVVIVNCRTGSSQILIEFLFSRGRKRIVLFKGIYFRSLLNMQFPWPDTMKSLRMI